MTGKEMYDWLETWTLENASKADKKKGLTRMEFSDLHPTERKAWDALAAHVKVVHRPRTPPVRFPGTGS